MSAPIADTWEARMSRRALERNPRPPAYGDLGEALPSEVCRECWGGRYVWLDPGWGWKHAPPGLSRCRHSCHDDEVWLA